MIENNLVHTLRVRAEGMRPDKTKIPALIDHAADAITAQAARIAELEKALRHLTICASQIRAAHSEAEWHKIMPESYPTLLLSINLADAALKPQWTAEEILRREG